MYFYRNMSEDLKVFFKLYIDCALFKVLGKCVKLYNKNEVIHKIHTIQKIMTSEIIEIYKAA